MSVIIFIIILGALIFVHELGHFLVAKKSGIRVDEFAVGFPPKIVSYEKGGTKYSLNAIPFGGYVKIFGEDLNAETLDKDKEYSFANKPKYIQIAVLAAGVIFNLLFAWALLSINAKFAGVPVPADEYSKTEQTEKLGVFVSGILEESPAANAGLTPQSKIISIQNESEKVEFENITPEEIIRITKESESEVAIILEDSAGNETEFILEPSLDQNNEKFIGVMLSPEFVIYTPGIFESVWVGLEQTISLTYRITIAFKDLIFSAFTGQGSLENVAGPVGIVKIVDDFYKIGFFKLVEFTAIISINLAILNILPFPALDGGRIAMVCVEAITRRQIKPAIANALNLFGFVLLIGFMVFITVKDVLKLF